MLTSSRTFFIDRLRVVLTVLVILHHTAITYGGSGGWFYREVTDAGTHTSLLLTMFCAVNQSFFMGMFFLLAGYFTPAALQRKGAGRFLRERLVRLGMPLLFFGFVLGPLTVALAGAATGGAVFRRFSELLLQAAFVIGPLWFAWALLLFALAFMAWQWLYPAPSAATEPAPPTSTSWLLAALAVGAAALLLRQWVPVGQNVAGLQVGYFASYIFLFALGCVAARYRWLELLEHRQARWWFRVSLATIPLLFVVAAFSGALQGRSVNFNGGLGLPAIAYAFWEPFVAWGVIAKLLVHFRVHFNTPNRAWQSWGSWAYGAFIVHAPILVALSVAVAGWSAPPALKFLAVGVSAVGLSFAAAGVLYRLPALRRVL